ncbi:HPr family phosphocarrier protein [Virgibacillus halophilus]|uniref:HPr family phosphocarrier protein n=1 Tax=Tigheibacillus halophilus TaxID=361280 RepID=A0ABU5C9E6_9BACI|nr:HPr family phosphocarrier protein [Virgibacillus halophilus]
MVERSVTVTLETGLQARPAAQFVQDANRYAAHLFLEKDGKRINAKSIMGLMSLAVTQGETILLIADGPDEEDALNYLTTFVEQKEAMSEEQ